MKLMIGNVGVFGVIGIVCLGLVSGCVSKPKKCSDLRDAPVIRFVQLSDSHYGNPLHAYRFRQAVSIIHELPFDIDFVVHTGDLSSDNFHLEATAIAISNQLSNIQKPLLVLPGNHDMSVKGPTPAERLEKCAEHYRRYIGPFGMRLEVKGVVFLALYTEPLRGKTPSVDVMGFEPLEWLKEQIRLSKGHPIFVFTHTPDGPDFYGNEEHAGWPEPQRSQWRTLLQKGNVQAVIAGHYHRDELQMNSDCIPTHVGNSIANFWGRQGSFRIYTYQAGQLSYRTVYLDDPPNNVHINADGTLGPPTTSHEGMKKATGELGGQEIEFK